MFRLSSSSIFKAPSCGSEKAPLNFSFNVQTKVSSFSAFSVFKRGRHFQVEGDHPLFKTKGLRVVVALGGNALLQKGEALTADNQRKNVQKAIQSLAEIARNHELIITHGNGPQVGLLALQAAAFHDVPAYPLDVLGAESEAQIGYVLEQELENVLPERETAAILTQVEVDPTDPAFDNWVKPVGPFYTAEQLEDLKREYPAWRFVEVVSSKKGPDGVPTKVISYRRAVPSPEPQRIVELKTIQRLVNDNVIVICGGGGGIPVLKKANTNLLMGCEAVIDKDYTSSLLADKLNADVLIMLTDVDAVCHGWGTPQQKSLNGVFSPDQLGDWKEYGAGSMGPKVRAAQSFVSPSHRLSYGAKEPVTNSNHHRHNLHRYAAIGSLARLSEILTGKSGTIVSTFTPESEKQVQRDIAEIIETETFDYTYNPSEWCEEQRYAYLRKVLNIPLKYVELIRHNHYLTSSRRFVSITIPQLEKKGMEFEIAAEVVRSIHNLYRNHPEADQQDLEIISQQYSCISVDAAPYKWPYNQQLRPDNTALVVIDMQIDFCAVGGYVHSMGYSLENTSRPIKPIKRLLEIFRRKGFHIIHTREGHRPDLSDLPAVKRWRSERIGAGIGDTSAAGRILVKGSKGWQIVPDLTPQDDEPVIDKPGKGAFYATDLDLILRSRGIQNLILSGVTSDVCVSTTIREANDRGYECLMLEDCCAAVDEKNHLSTISSIQMSGGIFGCTTSSDSLIRALHLLPDVM